MKQWSRAILAALVVAVGYIAQELTLDKSYLRYTFYIIAILAVFLFTLWEMRPDETLKKVRKSVLDDKVQTFLGKTSSKKKIGERSVIRANVMVVKRTWYYWPKLDIVYSYNMRSSDPDYGYTWMYLHGACWAVHKDGKTRYTSCTEDNRNTYNLNEKDCNATSHLYGVLSIPIRSTEGKRCHRVKAILNFDALSEQAAKDLKDNEEKFNKDTSMETLLEFVSYFFEGGT